MFHGLGSSLSQGLPAHSVSYAFPVRKDPNSLAWHTTPFTIYFLTSSPFLHSSVGEKMNTDLGLHPPKMCIVHWGDTHKKPKRIWFVSPGWGSEAWENFVGGTSSWLTGPERESHFSAVSLCLYLACPVTILQLCTRQSLCLNASLYLSTGLVISLIQLHCYLQETFSDHTLSSLAFLHFTISLLAHPKIKVCSLSPYTSPLGNAYHADLQWSAYLLTFSIILFQSWGMKYVSLIASTHHSVCHREVLRKCHWMNKPIQTRI